MPANLSLEDYFRITGFADLLPLALKWPKEMAMAKKKSSRPSARWRTR